MADLRKARAALRRFVRACGSQAEAARRLGCSPTLISLVLSGQRVVSFEFAATLARASGVSVTAFVREGRS